MNKDQLAESPQIKDEKISPKTRKLTSFAQRLIMAYTGRSII